MRDLNQIKPWRQNTHSVRDTILEYAEAFAYALVMLFVGWLLIIILAV